MKIIYKLILGFLLIVSLILVAFYYAVDTSRNALEEMVVHSSVHFADDVLNNIDRGIYYRIEVLQDYSKDLVLQEAVTVSNREFERLEDVRDYITQRDKEWVSAPQGRLTLLMEDLLNNELARELTEKVNFYDEKYEYSIFPEAYVTNRYGVVIASTGRSSDYLQADEEWYRKAVAEKEFWVGNVEYDESSDTYATDIVVNLYDENGTFTGILKGVLNIEYVIGIIKESEQINRQLDSEYMSMHYELVTGDGKVIYSTRDFEMLEETSVTLQAFDQHEEGHGNYNIITKDNGNKLAVHTHSRGYRDFKGLGWTLIVEYESDEIFAPVVDLRSRLLYISSAIALLAIVLSILISRSIARPIERLKEAASKIGDRELDTKIGLNLPGELGELAVTFNKMAEDLQVTTVSRDELATEMAEREEAEEKIITQSKVLKAINKIFLERIRCNTEEDFGKACLTVAEELTESSFGFIGELNEKGLFDTIAISNPGWDECNMPEDQAALVIRDMPVRGVDRGTMADGRSRIVNGEEAVMSHPDHVELPEGHPKITSFLGVPLKQQGQVIGMIALGNKNGGYDVTDQENIEAVAISMVEALKSKRANMKLLKSEKKYRDLTQNLSELIYRADPETLETTYVNPAIERIYGYTPEEWLADQTLWEKTIHPDDRGRVLSVFEEERREQEGAAIEYRIVRKDGSVRWVEDRFTWVKDREGEALSLEGILYDITDKRETEDHIHHLAYFDDLTGLPNRKLFFDRLNQGIYRVMRNKKSLALLYIDLDNFKNVNDTLGHPVGDMLLKAVGKRLSENMRKSTTVSRLGGDEFAVVIDDISDHLDIINVAERIFDLLKAPLKFNEHEVFVSATLGIAIYPDDGDDARTLLKNSDTAMYHAKKQGKNSYQFYTAEMNVELEKRMGIESKLRHALEKEEFTLHYQPLVELEGGSITGVESLIRWYPADGVLISPMDFIPVAEETNLILEIDRWVLHAACTQMKLWQERGFANRRISVNISGVHFRRARILETVDRVLEDTGLRPDCLEIEITEGVLMEDVEEAVSTLRQLRSRGISIAVDDFGTGYSSLSYLKRFPITRIKIDQSFISDVTTDNESAAITRTIIAMARNLKMEVIAEGVETKEQLEFLRVEGCNHAQGYYFSKPLPAEELEKLIDKHKD